jgi:ferric-dicitrate binding protein FerR (iron transport regulator)
VESLRDAYGADIVIENKALGSLSITTTFKQEPLDNILDIVAQTLGIKVVKNGEQYILR